MSLRFGILQQSGFTPYTDTYTTAGTYNTNVPAGCTQIVSKCWGVGGTGGGILANTAGHRGGGAGAQCVIKTVINPTVGHAIQIVVGAAKAGTSGDAGSGNDSYVSINSSVVCRAKGGAGASGSTGGLGSTVNGVGDTIYKGGNGANGGVNYSGGGGEGASDSGNGNNASTYNAGSGTSGADGGAGFQDSTWNGGRNGSSPGGGGSGAIATDNSIPVAFTGGGSPAGKIVISYS